MKQALGMLEFKSIARGIEATDAALKAGNVEVVQSWTLCSGKYATIVAGEIAAVENAVNVGAQVGAHELIDQLVIANLHPRVMPALKGCTVVEKVGALGVIETMTVVGAIFAADAAAKAATVEVLEIRVAQGLGGKAFVVLTGEVAAVKTGITAAQGLLHDEGTLLATTVIPAPHKNLVPAIL